VYLRARWHNPALGRFHQVDPVVGPLTAPATWQPYAYALNNPLRYSDASGRFPWLIVGAAAVGAAIDYGAQVYRNRQAGLDWGAALTTNIDAREVVAAAGAGGLVAIAVPEVISMAGLGLAGTGLGLYGLSQTLGGGSGAIPQYLARSSAWASTGLWRGASALGGAAQAAAEAVYGLRSCPAAGADKPATVRELVDMMNKRPNVHAEFAEDDMLDYLRAPSVNAEGSHLYLDGESYIAIREEAATRRSAMHEWLHHVYRGIYGPDRVVDEDKLIENWLASHKDILRLE